MSSVWPEVPLGQVLVQDRRYVTTLEPREYPKLSVKLYGKGVALDSPADAAQLKMQRHQFAKAGQVILSEIWGKKGAIGFVPREGDGALCTSHFFLFDLLRDKIEPGWLGAIFRANYLADKLGASAFGTTGYAAVRPKDLLATTIPLPPLPEQRRIVANVEELAVKVEEARNLRTVLSPEIDALLPAVRNTLLGNEPVSGWLPLHTIVSDIENGWSPQCESWPAADGEWAVLKVGAVSFGYFDSRENKALPTTLKPKPEYEIRPGDFLISRANTRELVGACTLVEESPPHLLLCDKIFRFIFKHETPVLPAFLNQVLKSPALRAQIERLATGTSPTMKNISKAKILSLRVPLVETGQQRRIVSYLKDLQTKVDFLKALHAQTQADLDALLPSILDKAFKGEL